MNISKYKSILMFIPLVCLASQKEERGLSDDSTDKYYKHFKENLALNEEEYWVDWHIGKAMDSGYEVWEKYGKRALKSIPWVGEFFGNSWEQLEVARKSFKKLKTLSDEIKRSTEHMRNIYDVYKKGEQIKATLAKAWKKSETTPLLLDIARELTGIDPNPDLYLKGLPFAASFRHKWSNLTRETELTERLKAFQQISEHEMKWYGLNIRIDSLVKTIPILRSQSEILLKEISVLKKTIQNNRKEELEKSLHDQLGNKLKEFQETQDEERKALNKLAELRADLSNLKKESSMNILKAKMLKKQRDQLRKRAGIRTTYEVERDDLIIRSRRGIKF